MFKFIKLITSTGFLFASGILLLGCGASSVPPEGARIFESPPPPKAGTKYVYRYGNGLEETWVVNYDHTPFRGAEVYSTEVVGRNYTRVWDSQTHNFTAAFRGDTLLRYYSPHGSQFEWPMWVGKRWNEAVTQVIKIPTYRHRVAGTRMSPVSGIARVQETITVPAGTFETMRITVRFNRGGATTFWRAADIPVPVKWKFPYGGERSLVSITPPN